MCVHFQEEPLAAVEVGEASSPPDPLKVSEEFVEHADSICMIVMSLLQILTSLQGQNGHPRPFMQ